MKIAPLKTIRHVRIVLRYVPAGLLAICIFFFSATTHAAPKPIVTLNSQAPAALHKLQWDFYWKQYLYPGDFRRSDPVADLVLPQATIWNGLVVAGQKLDSFGYATYRLRVAVKAKSERLALRLTIPLSSYRLFVNGVKLAEEGNLGTSEEGFTGRRRPVLVYFTGTSDDLEIIVQVSNYLLHKGGLRGTIELGYAAVMQTYGLRFLSIDVFCIGLIFAIMLYHFLLYFLSRKNLSILIFALLALDYFLLASLYGESSIHLLLPDLPMSVHTRLSSAMAYLLPALVLQFTSTLFPKTISSRARKTFWIAALVFCSLLWLPPRYFMLYNVFYFGIAGTGAGIVCIHGIWQAVRERQAGARLLAVGMLLLFALSLYAVYLFATHSQAGSFLSIGFSLFALTQSGSLAHAHAALARDNLEMQQRLERSRNALESQRKQIEANLHDSLGGNLTDIKLALEALYADPRVRVVKNEIRRLDHRVTGTIASLRTELLFLEDLQLAMDDFVSGINLILLRRHQMARRPVDIQVTPETRELGRQLRDAGILNDEVVPQLCLIVQELCSNSLKYSAGTAQWEILATHETLRISISGKSRHRAQKKGRGQETLRKRAAQIGATFSEQLTGDTYSASIQVP